MVRKKRQSKRMKLKDQHKIRKKVHAHQKKIKKDIKKNPQLQKRMRRENLKVPNTWPVKQELLKKMINKKEKGEEENNQDLDELESNELSVESNDELSVESNEELLVQSNEEDSVEREAMEEEIIPAEKKIRPIKKKKVSKKEYFKNYLNVIKNADIIVEVLDGRDPLGTRSFQVEKLISETDPNKVIILLINKIDLLSKNNLVAWLNHFRKQLPTIAFQSAVEEDSICLGANTLLRAINNYIKHSNRETIVRVGIIGFPNVGKSSVIKSLESHFQANVTEEGISLAPNILLMDKPGTIISCPNTKKINGALRNATDLKYVMEPLSTIKYLVDLFPKDVLLQLYKIPMFKDHISLLHAIILKNEKKITPTEVINTARIIHEDWLTGKIPYHTIPPEESQEDRSKDWSEMFKINQLISIEKNTVLDKLVISPKKIMFSTAIKPIRVFIHPSWKILDRAPDDLLFDIKEDIVRKKQKQQQKKSVKNQPPNKK